MPRSLIDVEVGAVGDGRRHVRSVGERPEHVRLRDVAAAAGLQRQHRPLSRRRDDQIAVHHRRGDDAVVAVVVGIEAVRAPELLPGCRVVAGHDVAAGDDDLGRRAVAQQRRRRVRVGRFHPRLRRPLDAPHASCRSPCRCAAGTTDRPSSSRAAPARRARRRAAAATTRIPSSGRSARSPSGCRAPKLLAREIERLEDAGAGHHPDVRPSVTGDGVDMFCLRS